MATPSGAPERRLGIAAWFLAASYGLTAPICIALEIRSASFSERFDIPPMLLYATSVVQFVCAVLVLRPRTACGAAVVLTFTTLGAMGAHLRMGSPLTAVPALAYSLIQIWFALACRRRDRAR